MSILDKLLRYYAKGFVLMLVDVGVAFIIGFFVGLWFVPTIIILPFVMGFACEKMCRWGDKQ